MPYMVFKENSHRNMEKTLHLFLMKFFVPYRWYNLFLVCEQEDFFCVLPGLRSLGADFYNAWWFIFGFGNNYSTVECHRQIQRTIRCKSSSLFFRTFYFISLSQDGVFCEILWSDPCDSCGKFPNKRGVGIEFGPDITKV